MLEYQIVLVLIIVAGLVCIDAAKLWMWSKSRRRKPHGATQESAARGGTGAAPSPRGASQYDASNMS